VRWGFHIFMFAPTRFSLLTTILVANICPAASVDVQAKHRKPKSSTIIQRHIPSSREIASRISRSLVLVVMQDNEGEPIARGSGFFFDVRVGGHPRLPPGVLFVDGDIVTSLHIFKRASQGYIKTLGEGLTYRITEIVGVDLEHDLCVFKAAGASMQPLSLATETKVAVGEDVYVGGNPRGLEATISKGIVSAIRTNAGLIQIDAPISPGSSGGPVVNTRGDVIGIVSLSLTEGQNLNFAIDRSFLAALPLDAKMSVSAAGALALKNR